MRYQPSAPIGALAILFAVAWLSPAAGQAPTKAAKTPKTATNWTPARTEWGDPDLQGIWTNLGEVGTPFERPSEVGGKQVFEDEELAEIVRARQARIADPEERKRVVASADLSLCARDNTCPGGGTGNGPVHWFEHLDPRSTRPWFVVDPPDGGVPPLTSEGQRKAAERAKALRGRPRDWNPDWVDDPILGTWQRCITRGLPAMMIPTGYNNNYQILQAPGYVVILYEMIHETRIIPVDGRPSLSPTLTQWLGDSRGRWEGNTLVVDVTNFSSKTDYKESSTALHLIERFTRAGPDQIDYQFTVDDPTTFTKSWTAAIPLTKDDTQDRIFEYACHEGNYGLVNILSAARAKDKAR